MKPLSEMTNDELAQENKAMSAMIAEAQKRKAELAAEVGKRGRERRINEARKMLALHFPDIVIKGEGSFTPPPEKTE